MKKNILYLGRDGRPSILKVYSQMTGGEVLVKRTLKRKNKEPKVFLRNYTNNVIDKLKKLPLDTLDFKNAVVIRWGNRLDAPTDAHTIVYNKIEAIKLATDKRQARETFLAANTRAPKLYTPDSPDITYPIIARPLVHSKGKNFVVIKTLAEFINHFKEGWYYSEYIDKEKEFRVHCAHGKVLAVMEKPRVEGQMAWNRAINHEAFERVLQKDYNKDVCTQALAAIKAIGLDFGGVDVVFKNKKAYVLEVNTAPTLNSSEYVSAQYAKYFTWLFKEETRRPHWEFEKFQKAESLAWKQDQLL